MKVLIDSHALMWLATDDSRLSSKAKQVFSDKRNEMYFSLASVWELAIKYSLGKIKLQQPITDFLHEQIIDNAVQLLSIELEHVTFVSKLEFHRRDPFDRLLVAQSMLEKLSLLSADEEFDKYGVKRIW